MIQVHSRFFSFFCEYLCFCLQKEKHLNKHLSVLTPSTVFCFGKMRCAHKCLKKKCPSSFRFLPDSLISMALLEFACPFCRGTCIGKIASSEPLGRGYACLASPCIMQSKQGDGEDIPCLQEQHWAEGVYCKCTENFCLAYLFSNKAPSLQHYPES